MLNIGTVVKHHLTFQLPGLCFPFFVLLAYFFVRYGELLLQDAASLQGNTKSLPHLHYMLKHSHPFVSRLQNLLLTCMQSFCDDPEEEARSYLLIKSFVVFKKWLQGFEDFHFAGDSCGRLCLSLHHRHSQTAFMSRHQALQVLQQQLNTHASQLKRWYSGLHLRKNLTAVGI